MKLKNKLDDGPTNKITYSWNEGLSWEEVEFSNLSFNVRNILTEPTNMAEIFIVYGYKYNNSTKQREGYTVTLDFTSLHKRVCKGNYYHSI